MLNDHETNLVNGHRLKLIGNEYVILDENGMQVGQSMHTESLAIIRLVDHRVNYAQEKHADTVISAASRYRNAQAWLSHLEDCEEDRDDDAINRAKCDLTVAEVALDNALAKAGDKYAACRLDDSKPEREEAAHA